MTKTDLIKVVTEKVNEGNTEKITQKVTDAVLAAYVDTVTEVLGGDKDEKIGLGNLGNFRVKEVKERTGIIQMGDRKGEKYVTPAHNEITFKMSKLAKTLE